MNKIEFDKMVLDNLSLVKIIALKILSKVPAGIELDDLIHTGILGLIDAINKFDPSKKVKFTTYASLRIRGAILDELRNLDWASRGLRTKIKEVENAYKDLEQRLGRPAKDEEVAKELNMKIEDFYKLLDNSRGIGVGVFRYSTEDEVKMVEEDRLLRYFIDEKSNSPAFIVEKEEMKRILTVLIDSLPEKERLVLSFSYIDELNLSEIGEILKLSESRISQIRTSAVLRLRGKIIETAMKNGVEIMDVI